jgi:two-component system, cell cycle sensor histidine kinase and response regulator CckA
VGSRDENVKAGEGIGDSGRPVILFVDDEDAVRRLGARALTGAGFEVVTAADGSEAINVFQQHHAVIALIVVDMTMPKVSGIDALRAFKSVAPNVPVLLSTGLDCDDSSVDQGFAGTIQKPYRLATLIDIVNRTLQR